MAINGLLMIEAIPDDTLKQMQDQEQQIRIYIFTYVVFWEENKVFSITFLGEAEICFFFHKPLLLWF